MRKKIEKINDLFQTLPGVSEKLLQDLLSKEKAKVAEIEARIKELKKITKNMDPSLN